MWSDAITYVMPIVLGVLGGFWLDKQFGTSPWLTLIGMAWGIATTMYLLISAGRRKR